MKGALAIQTRMGWVERILFVLTLGLVGYGGYRAYEASETKARE